MLLNLLCAGPAPAGTDGRPAFSWGARDDGTRLLARAVITDAVGPEWADRLAGPFADEVVANLPPTGFELRVADVAAWLNSHSSTD